jgi:hypothetical protein
MTLKETYYEINRNLGNNAEPLESVRLVETYGRYLKPEKVRVVLLAESHVFTSDEDRRVIRSMGEIEDALSHLVIRLNDEKSIGQTPIRN